MKNYLTNGYRLSLLAVAITVLSLCLQGYGFCAESITITTYYPAPYGVYQQLRLNPTTPSPYPVCDANSEGTMFYDNNLNSLRICRETYPGIYGWQYGSSLWLESGKTNYASDPNNDPIAIAPINQDWQVGVGNVQDAWNRSVKFTVVDNKTKNSIGGPDAGEQIALMNLINTRRGNSTGTASSVKNINVPWSGAGDSVTALELIPGENWWQVRADEFDADAAADSYDRGAFMIHQTVNGAPATRLVIRNNGYVGIGNIAPIAKLDIIGNPNTPEGGTDQTMVLRAADSASSAGITFYGNSFISNDRSDYTNRAFIGLAGTCNHWGWSTHAGDLSMGAENNHDIRFVTSIIAPLTPIVGPTDTNLGTARVIIKANGQVGIGANRASEFPPVCNIDPIEIESGALLTVNGDIYCRGHMTERRPHGEESDLSFKKDIATIPNALNRVLALRGVNYYWKDEDIGKSLQMGLIGQEVEKVFPELVYTDTNGKKSLAYTRFTAVLIEAVKQQQEKISSLEARIKALEAKNK